MGSNLTMKITFIHRHRLLGLMLFSSKNYIFIWLVNFTHHHPFKFQMMIHPCIDISFNGLKFHTIYKHCTHTHTQSIKLELKTFQIASKMQVKKKLLSLA
jgi:hypothetical protein